MRNLLSATGLVILLFLSCTKEDKPYEINGDFIQSDQELVRQWIFTSYKPEMNPSLEFTLNSLTTEDINSKLGARVYSVISDVPGLEGRGILIKDNKVYDLGRYNLMGASEPKDLLVADLNNDLKYELYYSVTHGSGILRTNILCYMDDSADVLLPVNASFYFPLDYSIRLQKTSDDKHVKVFYNSGSTHLKIGEIELTQTGDSLQCTMRWIDDLPQSVVDNVNGKR